MNIIAIFVNRMSAGLIRLKVFFVVLVLVFSTSCATMMIMDARSSNEQELSNEDLALAVMFDMLFLGAAIGISKGLKHHDGTDK